LGIFTEGSRDVLAWSLGAISDGRFVPFRLKKSKKDIFAYFQFNPAGSQLFLPLP
jgi:hypothetical protein